MLGGVAALAALIGGTVMGVYAANGTFDTLTAKTLLLKNGAGKTRVELRGSNGSLRLYHYNGKERIKLHSDGYTKANYISADHMHKGKSERKASHTHSVTVR